jgi:hypothetical protein
VDGPHAATDLLDIVAALGLGRLAHAVAEPAVKAA